MMYADYAYYIGDYGGTSVPEDCWRHAAGQASERMDAATFGRLESGIPAECETRVKRCCCEMAEQIYSASFPAASAGDGAAVASEKNGAYSVTYRSAAENAAALLHGTTAGLEDLLQNIIRKHLGRTGLLYRGCDMDVHE